MTRIKTFLGLMGALSIAAIGYAGKALLTLFNDIWPVVLAGVVGTLASLALYWLGIPHSFLPEAAALTAIVTTIYKENK